MFLKIKYIKYSIKVKLKSLFTGRKIADDFDWQLYTEHYQGELEDIGKHYTQILRTGDYEFRNGQLLMKNKILPLHPNYRLLYETVLQLHPNSVMEVGCGGGDHIYNINILQQFLNSNIKFYGVDVSDKQLAFLKERHPNLNAYIECYDIALPIKLDLPKVDIVYTQAVIMHIKTRNAYLVALANLFYIASKQIILMENWKQHEFMKDILFLYNQKMLPWESIYFYYRESEELKKPHIMIISSKPLEQYPPLSDYKILS